MIPRVTGARLAQGLSYFLHWRLPRRGWLPLAPLLHGAAARRAPALPGRKLPRPQRLQLYPLAGQVRGQPLPHSPLAGPLLGLPRRQPPGAGGRRRRPRNGGTSLRDSGRSIAIRLRPVHSLGTSSSQGSHRSRCTTSGAPGGSACTGARPGGHRPNPTLTPVGSLGIRTSYKPVCQGARR